MTAIAPTANALVTRKNDFVLAGPVGSFDAYMDKVSRIPVLSREEEAELANRFRKDGDLEVFVKGLADGGRGIALLNRGEAAVEMEVRWVEDLGVDWPAATVRDLWAHRDLGEFSERFTATVGSHQATMLRLGPTKAS